MLWMMPIVILASVASAILASQGYDISSAIKDWQTIIGAGVSLLAAVIAFNAVKSQIDNTIKLENRKRQNKFNARRSILQIHLSEIIDFLEKYIKDMSVFLETKGKSPLSKFFLPKSTMKLLSDLIEYGDHLDTDSLRNLIMQLQVFKARTSMLVSSDLAIESEKWLEITVYGFAVDGLIILAMVSSMFDFARGNSSSLGETPTVEEIEQKYQIFAPQLDEEKIYKIIQGRKGRLGPFQVV